MSIDWHSDYATEYRRFEDITNRHTNFMGEQHQIVCSPIVVEMIKSKPYEILQYEKTPIYLVVLDDYGRSSAFAFFDEKYGFDESKIVDFIMNAEMCITEVQVRKVAGLENLMKEAS